ncbi:hypothetical protein FQA39_LY03319 [Lamprigera yunnana]|nr:hypothetical protein FQA39_LY03319 [Lamprigera yunnana]
MSFLEKPNVNTVPYIQPLDTPLAPERFVRILGAVLPFGRVFSCNLQCGSHQFDDVGLQISAELIENTIVINSQQHGSWNEEQTFFNFKVNRGQFEILIICEFTVFKVNNIYSVCLM